ncbi:MAG TPA: 3-ketoacyl-ACP reductase [Candidatus Bathyarchaeia archaeon]|nr:3-ketoacyl-ACP reductase [Candidatus Bathyarchaeia archaeon]
MGKAVAFITGASRGIGRGIALQLAEHGYDIVAAATRANPSERRRGVYEVKARVEQLGQRCLPVAGDIADLESHRDMIHRALDHFGAIDLLVNNAGVAPLHRLDILETSPESYDRLLAINARGPFFLTQAVARVMIEQVKAGRALPPAIIFITSISANTASPNRAEYCVSKAALSMTAQNYAVRLAPYGICVYEIRPGIIATDMTAAVREKYDDLIANGLLLQGRWGVPEDVGKAVVGLAEGYFNYATGMVIEVGGGFGIQRL